MLWHGKVLYCVPGRGGAVYMHDMRRQCARHLVSCPAPPLEAIDGAPRTLRNDSWWNSRASIYKWEGPGSFWETWSLGLTDSDGAEIKLPSWASWKTFNFYAGDVGLYHLYSAYIHSAAIRARPVYGKSVWLEFRKSNLKSQYYSGFVLAHELNLFRGNTGIKVCLQPL